MCGQYIRFLTFLRKMLCKRCVLDWGMKAWNGTDAFCRSMWLNNVATTLSNSFTLKSSREKPIYHCSGVLFCEKKVTYYATECLSKRPSRFHRIRLRRQPYSGTLKISSSKKEVMAQDVTNWCLTTGYPSLLDGKGWGKRLTKYHYIR